MLDVVFQRSHALRLKKFVVAIFFEVHAAFDGGKRGCRIWSGAMLQAESPNPEGFCSSYSLLLHVNSDSENEAHFMAVAVVSSMGLAQNAVSGVFGEREYFLYNMPLPKPSDIKSSWNGSFKPYFYGFDITESVAIASALGIITNWKQYQSKTVSDSYNSLIVLSANRAENGEVWNRAIETACGRKVAQRHRAVTFSVQDKSGPVQVESTICSLKDIDTGSAQSPLRERAH
ncbi:unnamed protein product [Protopolystoma xenopodis]|uniref:Uncharacterized protein n=1 Tax=Protopolystoma xenopodis TaxID=117903 RepID=A0A448WW51_9PLAT|nr:unnamed protein product [Protopolystoma xenopodis]